MYIWCPLIWPFTQHIHTHTHPNHSFLSLTFNLSTTTTNVKNRLIYFRSIHIQSHSPIMSIWRITFQTRIFCYFPISILFFLLRSPPISSNNSFKMVSLILYIFIYSSHLYKYREPVLKMNSISLKKKQIKNRNSRRC